MCKISVIIPVYNTEKYLEQCLNSVINQTLKDIEIICVNDCSTDNSLEILKEYSQKDKRIKIIDLKENKGVSNARNIGINKAEGEYIGFVDSDDWIDDNYYETLYNLAITKSSDIAKGNICEHINHKIQKDLFNINKNIKYNNGKLFFYTYWVCAIYKRKLIVNNDLKFDEKLTNGEDGLFLIQSLKLSNHVTCDDSVFYHYVRREESANSQFLNDNALKSLLKAYYLIFELINQQPNDTGYSDICFFYIQNTIKNIFRTTNKILKKECINQAFNIYTNSLQKKDLINKIKKEFPCLYLYFEKEDIDNIMKILLNKSFKQFITDNLRKKIALGGNL